jgi:phosphopantetheine adenylyltransferase
MSKRKNALQRNRRRQKRGLKPKAVHMVSPVVKTRRGLVRPYSVEVTL